jgi:porin
MRSWLLVLAVMVAFGSSAFAQEDKKTDDLKPADPDTGGSTVEEATLGLLPNPFEKQGIKFAVTYIGEVSTIRPAEPSRAPPTKIGSTLPPTLISRS